MWINRLNKSRLFNLIECVLWICEQYLILIQLKAWSSGKGVYRRSRGRKFESLPTCCLERTKNKWKRCRGWHFKNIVLFKRHSINEIKFMTCPYWNKVFGVQGNLVGIVNIDDIMRMIFIQKWLKSRNSMSPATHQEYLWTRLIKTKNNYFWSLWN